MTQSIHRRDFLGGTLSAGLLAAIHVNPTPAADSQSPNEKLNIAFVGVGNKGWGNVAQLRNENVAVLCDVDTNFLGKAAEQFPKAKQYRDYRRMLDAEHKNIDAVVVSTADHSHAGPTALAITLGKHVYCEKPLTHTVAEARHLAQLAAKHKVVTQMGTQVHASGNYRRVVEMIQSGAIGKVHEVYNWCNKDWSGGKFAPSGQPAPSYVDWDLWLGPAQERPYSPGIHPFHWRRFWEYGTGTFGDMAAHIMDLPFWALGLRYPTSVVAEGAPVDPVGAARWVMARYEFPARGAQPPVSFFWSDGGHHHDIVKKTEDYNGKALSTWGLGVLFVGDKGMLAADYGRLMLLPKRQFEGYQPPKPTIPNSIGHWNEWANACKTAGPTTCNFDYAGALTETILLGVVAYRAGEKLEWDAEQLKVSNTSKADELLTKKYRKGFEVVGLQ
ncbi:MAG: Gfo/Idh/MocA family protein [Gemmataceae bacterium]